MVIAGIPREEIRHTRAVQDWLAEGRQEGRQEGRSRLDRVAGRYQLKRGADSAVSYDGLLL